MIDYMKFWLAAKLVELLICLGMFIVFGIFWLWVTRKDKP